MRTSRARAQKILVVDDDQDIRDILAEALSMDGYCVSTAANGKIALAQAVANQPDLIVLDLMMPVMNGWQFLEAQRRHRRLATTPVIVVTAALDPKVDGTTLLLRKPFDLETLLAIIGRALDGDGSDRPLHELSA